MTSSSKSSVAIINNSDNEYKPKSDLFPYKQMIILSLAMFASAISMSGLFPYVGIMVVDLGMTDTINTSGYFAGYIAASMMCGRLCSSIFWGTMADRIGRKPIISMGCLSIAVFSLLFGLSINYTMAVFTRFLLGLFNPIIGISKTVVSEVCTKKHESMGMGVMTGCWSLGLIIGPAVGGLLANPVENYPNIFQNSYFLKQFPYFLPNMITAIFSLVAFVLFILYFPETLPMPSTTSTTIMSTSVNTTKAPSAINTKSISSSSSNLISNIYNRLSNNHKYSLLHSDSNTISNSECDIERGVHREVSSATTVEQNDEDDDDDNDDNEEKIITLSPIHTTTDNTITTRLDNKSTNIDNSTLSTISTTRNLLIRTDTVTSTMSSSQSIRQPESNINDDHNNQSIENKNQSIQSTVNPTTSNLSLYQLIQLPGIWKILVAYMLISTVAISIDEVFPLWMMSTPSKGGFSLSSPQIGQIMSLTGFVLILFTFTAYPYISNKLGPAKSYLYGIIWGIPLVLLLSIIRSLQDALNFNSAISISLIISCLILSKIGNNLAFSSISLVINQSVPTNKRASINGIAMTVGSCARAIGPIFGSIIFAWSINNNYGFPLDFHFVFLLLSILSVINAVLFLSFYRSYMLQESISNASDPSLLSPSGTSVTEENSNNIDRVTGSKLTSIASDISNDTGSSVYRRRDIELGTMNSSTITNSINRSSNSNSSNVDNTTGNQHMYSGSVSSTHTSITNPILQAIKDSTSNHNNRQRSGGYSHLASDDGDTSVDEED